MTKPITSVEQLRAVLASVEPAYRLSASVGHVAGFGGPDYGGMISLINDLRRHPEEAASSAAAHAEWASADSVAGRATRVELMLAALDGLEHSGTPEQLAALAAYAAELRRCLTTLQ